MSSSSSAILARSAAAAAVDTHALSFFFLDQRPLCVGGGLSLMRVSNGLYFDGSFSIEHAKKSLLAFRPQWSILFHLLEGPRRETMAYYTNEYSMTMVAFFLLEGTLCIPAAEAVAPSFRSLSQATRFLLSSYYYSLYFVVDDVVVSFYVRFSQHTYTRLLLFLELLSIS